MFRFGHLSSTDKHCIVIYTADCKVEVTWNQSVMSFNVIQQYQVKQDYTYT